jgi:hypothetical protein
MKTFVKTLLLGLLFAGASAGAFAQNTVTLTATPSSANLTATPTLAWSTAPAASSCVASGGWSGTLAASGSQAATAINASATYTLTCSWSAGNAATLAWTDPTQNTDGSALTNLTGYHIYYGTSAGALNTVQTVTGATATGGTVTPLAAGTWTFEVRAVNANGTESANSNVVSKTIAAAATATAQATVTVVPAPNPPTNVTVN